MKFTDEDYYSFLKLDSSCTDLELSSRINVLSVTHREDKNVVTFLQHIRRHFFSNQEEDSEDQEDQEELEDQEEQEEQEDQEEQEEQEEPFTTIRNNSNNDSDSDSNSDSNNDSDSNDSDSDSDSDSDDSDSDEIDSKVETFIPLNPDNKIVTRNGNSRVVTQDEIWKLRGEDPRRKAFSSINNASFTYESELSEPVKSPENIAIEPPKPIDDGKKIVNRILNIDSQYRDSVKYPFATDFSIDLSEKVKNIVSVSMYSIQIPYTWYTINNYFGSNFFVIKCMANGLNEGDYDYKISISAGNYTSDNLVSSIQSSLNTLLTLYPDVLFGQTKIMYNSITAKLQLMIDITHIYNETNYFLLFPNVIRTEENLNYISNLPALFGYRDNTYFSFQVISAYIKSSDTERQFTVSALNNKIIILLYRGKPAQYVNEYTLGDTEIYATLEIVLSMGIFNASSILQDAERQLLLHPMLNPEFTFLQLVNNQFVLSINMDRKKVYKEISKNSQTFSYKTLVQFTEDASNPLWVGNNSLFQFTTSYNEINNIVSEEKSVVSELQIKTSPYIIFRCNKNSYESTYTIRILNNTYLLREYISAINEAFLKTYIESNTEFSCEIQINDFYPTISTKINHIIPTSQFLFSIDNCILQTLCKCRVDRVPSVSSFTIQDGGYYIDSTSNKIYVNSIGPENNKIPLCIFTIPIPQQGFFSTIEDLRNAVNLLFLKSKENNNFGIDLSKSTIAFTLNQDGQIQCTLSLIAEVLIETSDYAIEFHDESSSASTWLTYLGYKQSYQLSNSLLVSPLLVYENLMYLTNENSFFFLNPLQVSAYNQGIFTSSNEYSIQVRINLPLNMYYTKEQIIESINTFFLQSDVLYGSFVDCSNEYTKIRLNINKLFKSQDYKIVFFDNIDYFSCHPGNNYLQNVKWDTTLGWLMGFRNSTQYDLTQENLSINLVMQYTYYQTFENQAYSIEDNIIYLSSDTAINVNIYNYFLLAINDYCQNRLHDGIVMTQPFNIQPVDPIVNKSAQFLCSSSRDDYFISSLTNNLTFKQAYSANAKLDRKKKQVYEKTNIYSGAPPEDIFAMIPVKVAGLSVGASLVEFGESLQRQNRLYIGPATIGKMSFRLLNDKYSLLDLNGANWSFSLSIDTYL